MRESIQVIIDTLDRIQLLKAKDIDNAVAEQLSIESYVLGRERDILRLKISKEREDIAEHIGQLKNHL